VTDPVIRQAVSVLAAAKKLTPSEKSRTLDEIAPADVHLPVHEVRSYAGNWYPEHAQMWFTGTSMFPEFLDHVQRNGILRPVDIVTDGRRAQLWDGYHRLAAADTLGHDTVPVRVLRKPPSWFKRTKWFTDPNTGKPIEEFPVGEALGDWLSRSQGNTRGAGI